MKKMIILTALFLMISSFTVYGDYENIKVRIDGEEISFSYGAPFRDNLERIYVPVKDMIPALYGKYVWLSETDELYVSRGSAKFVKNSVPGDVDLLAGYGNYMVAYFKADNTRIAYFSKNGDRPREIKIVSVDGKPVFYNGNLYVPIRYIANLLGYSVDFDEETSTVICTDTGSQINIEHSVPDTEKTDADVRSLLEILFLTNSYNNEGKELVYSYFNGTANESQRAEAMRIAGMVKYKMTKNLAKSYLTDGGFGGFIMQMEENKSEENLINSILRSEVLSEELMQYVVLATENDREFLQKYIWDFAILGL